MCLFSCHATALLIRFIGRRKDIVAMGKGPIAAVVESREEETLSARARGHSARGRYGSGRSREEDPVTRNAKQILAAALVAALAVAGAAVAASSMDVIKERQQAMKEVGGAMQNLAAIAKKETPFEAEVVEKNAGIIAEALKRSADLFPEGSHKGDLETWAKAEICDETAFPPALGKLGNACKACHQTYRRPKN
jgi:cytochrome c556